MESNKLRPGLGLFSATMLVMGCIIGSGIFKKIAPMSLKLQSENLVLLAWVIAGLVTLFGALSYAEIASRLAQTGGLYAYLKAIYGKWTGYLFGWACFSVIQSASIASIAYVFGEALRRIFPQAIAPESVKYVTVSTILVLTFVNCLGLMFGAVVTNIFTVLKLAGIAVVVFLGFVYGMPGGDTVVSVGTGIASQGMGLLIPTMFSAILSALWAFDGINNLGFVGGEVKNAKKTIPFALILGVTAVLAIYLVVNLSYFRALPFDDILTIARTDGTVFAIEMVSRIKGDSWALFVAMLIMVSTFGTTNASILTSSRIYYAMANDGLFFRALGRAHPRFHTPITALLVQSVWASALVLWSNFDQLTDMLIFASFIFYGLGAWGVYILRARKTGEESKVLRVPSFVPLLYVIFCALLVGVTLYQDTLQSLVGVGLILLGIPLYWFVKRDQLKG